MTLPHLPLALKELLKDSQILPMDEGESATSVWQIVGKAQAYLKISAQGGQSPVLQDKLKLQWLEGRFPAPKVLAFEETEQAQFLLMSALEGLHPMHDDLAWTGQERLDFLAKALRRLHQVPIEECPYRRSISEQIAIAKENIEKGYVRLDLLEEENQNRDLWELFAELETLQPASEDWVVTHGDSYPMNMRAHPQSHDLIGFIDVGALAVADRYSDFAPVCNAIKWHLGESAIPEFFALYGIQPDWDKLHFYQLLDEFY